MTLKEFSAWSIVMEGSRFCWVVDPVLLANSGDFLAYRGGSEMGRYCLIHKNGAIEVGAYQGAFPHIGEACFVPEEKVQAPSFEAAVNRFFELTGASSLRRFLAGS
jgi:hypothetical protein